MFHWNVSALKAELVRAPLSQRAALRYLIATAIVVTLLPELIIRADLSVAPVDTVVAVADIIILVFGTLIAYAANGGDRGVDFLGRYFALTWVLGIRNLVGFLVTATLGAAVLELSQPGSLDTSSAFETAIATLVVVFSGLFYWRLAVHIRQVAFAAADTTVAPPTVAR